MSEFDVSKLKLYSLGIVVSNKELKNDLIRVMPIEVITNINENLETYLKKYTSDIPDINDKSKKTEVGGYSYLEAKWVPYGEDNRMTSPDVIKNETVRIYRYADTEEYYWATIFREPNIRRQETVCTMFGNIPYKDEKKRLEAFDKTSSYWWEISTHSRTKDGDPKNGMGSEGKLVHMHTSKNDGEFCTYDFHLDTKNGRMWFGDDRGNYISLDSKTGKWEISGVTSVTQKSPILDMLGSDVVNITSPESNLSGGQLNVSSVTDITANLTVDAKTELLQLLKVRGKTELLNGLIIGGKVGGSNGELIELLQDLKVNGNVDMLQHLSVASISVGGISL